MKKHIILLVLITIVTSFFVSFASQGSRYGGNTGTITEYSDQIALDQVDTFKQVSFLVPSEWRKNESLLFTTYYPNDGDSTKFEITQGLTPEKLNIDDITNKDQIDAYLEDTLKSLETTYPDYRLYDKFVSVFNDSYSVLINYTAGESDGFIYETIKRIYFTQQQAYTLTFTQPVSISKQFRAAFFDICDSVHIEDTTKKTNTLSAQDFIANLKAAGFPIRDEVVYDEITDPEILLGRPGEYVEKVDFSHEDVADLTIEIFDNEADAENRQEYYAFLKQYVFLNTTFLLRMPYEVPPSIASLYEDAFAKIISGEAVDNVSDYFPKTPSSEPEDLDAYAGNIKYELFPLLNGEAAVVFTNNNDIIIPSFEASIVFYDNDGDMLAMNSDVHHAVLPGSQVVTKTISIADPNIDFKNYSVQIKVDMDMNGYESLSEHLSIKSNESLDGGVIAKIKNNADIEIEELEVAVLFYVDGKVIAASEEEKYNILPGETGILKFRAPYDDYDRIDFDAYKLFINQAYHISY